MSTEGEGTRGAPRRGGCGKAGARRGAQGRSRMRGTEGLRPPRGRRREETRGGGAGPRAGGRRDDPAVALEVTGKVWEEGECGRPCEGVLKGSSPGGRGGVPAVPGPRRVPGPPGFPALGPSGRVAAAPPSPNERTLRGGRAQPPLPRGRRRAAPAGSVQSSLPASLAAARLKAGQPDGPLRRPAEFRPPGRRARAPSAERHPSLPLGTVGGAPASAHRKGAGRGRLHSALRRGSRAGPPRGGGGRPLA